MLELTVNSFIYMTMLILILAVFLVVLVLFFIKNKKLLWEANQRIESLNEAKTQLETAKEQAEKSSRSKSIFLSHMSREIRIPMNAILGIAEIQLQRESFSHARSSANTAGGALGTAYGGVSSVMEEGFPLDIIEAFEKIYESGDLLLNIINNMHDLSKLESGRLEIVCVKYNIPNLINDTMQLNRLRYESKPIELILHIDKSMPLELTGDELRIKQILNNIISNAFKYTNEGKIEFSVSVEPANKDDNVFLVFRISDTGQGMTDDQTEKLFDEYTRFNSEINRNAAGAGLGMNITKRLVDLMKGEVIAESIPGRGTVFTVRLPQKRSGTEVCGEALVRKLKSFNFHNTAKIDKMNFVREYMPYGSILVVDDVESNIYVAKGMLIPYGIMIDTASSGFEAVEKVKSGQVYDIIFMDHMMPKMDGIEAVKIIRDTGYTNPIIALTANALPGRAWMFLHNGFDSYISKPVDSRELNLVLNEFIKNRKPDDVVKEAQQVPMAERAARQRQAWDSEGTRAFRIMDFFVRDAVNAVNILENIKINDSEIESFITAVHGIKSALANIGEIELSGIALKLENAGRERDYKILSSAAPMFINTLKTLIANFKSVEDSSEFSVEETVSDGDKTFLNEKLAEIQKACAVFDKKTSKTALDCLKAKIWPKHINEVLNDIAVHLLHSEFSEIAELADVTLK